MTTATNTHIGVHTQVGRVELYVLDCPECGVIFAIPTEYEARRRDDARWFFCPNQHHMRWSETAEDRQRTRAEKAERALARERARHDQARAEAEHQRRRAAALKGAITRAKRRACRGKCPLCTTTFDNVAEHIADAHPEAIA